MTELGVLTGIALIIFIIEQRIPNLVPIPGVKLGLANIITVYAVYQYRAHETAMVVCTRVFLGAVFGGNISALLYSLSGGLCCLAGMLLLRRWIPQRQLCLCSIFGAIFHNIGQMAAAVCVMRTTAVLAYLPILTVSGCIAGAFTGLCAMFVLRRLSHLHDG